MVLHLSGSYWHPFSCVVLIACLGLSLLVLHDFIWAVEPTGLLLLWGFGTDEISMWQALHFCVLPLYGYWVLDGTSG